MKHQAQVITGLAAALVLNAGCSMLSSKPEVESVKPRIVGLDLQGIDLQFDVDISNPYPMALKTPGFKYGIEVEGSTVLKSDKPVALDLPSGKTSRAVLPARMSYGDVYQAAEALINESEVEYQLKGSAVLQALGESLELPVSYKGKFPILKMPVFAINGLNLSELSLTRAKITVEVLVSNPNVFELWLDNVGYVLQVGEASVGNIAASTTGTIPARDSGTLTLVGDIPLSASVSQLVSGRAFGNVMLAPTGQLKTPYGSIQLSHDHDH